jgi:hypothetical protein
LWTFLLRCLHWILQKLDDWTVGASLQVLRYFSTHSTRRGITGGEVSQ